MFRARGVMSFATIFTFSFCDFDLDIDKADQFAKLTSYIYEMRSMLMDVLDEEEIWIIYHSVTRVLGSEH